MYIYAKCLFMGFLDQEPNFYYRQLLKKVLRKVKESDNYVVRSGLFLKKHERSLFLIKRILFIFYAMNLTNEFTVYLPKRMDLNKETFSMTLCVGKKSHLVLSLNITNPSLFDHNHAWFFIYMNGNGFQVIWYILFP